MSFEAVVNEALRAEMAEDRVVAAARPYRLNPVSLGGIVGPYDLVKALQVADALEDEEIARELEIRK